MRVLLMVLLIIVMILPIASLRYIIQALAEPAVYSKDFIQEYLMGRAVLIGVSPYLELTDLANRIFGTYQHLVFLHPSPHPPPVAVISVPFGLLGFPQAAALWLGIELLCVVLVFYLLMKEFTEKPGFFTILFAAFLALGWENLMDELVIGQFNTILLVLFILAWKALRRDKDIVGGILLGCVLAIKLLGWPILLFFILQRKWKPVWGAVLTFVTLNILAGFIIGFSQVLFYYTTVSRTVTMLYRAYERNFSIWTIGWRFFYGTGSSALQGVEAPPLIYSPTLAAIVSIILPLLLLVIGLYLSYRSHDLDTAFGILICVSILVSPTAWSHYAILTAIPITVVLRRLIRLRWPRREMIFALVVGVLLFIPTLGIKSIMSFYALQKNPTDFNQQVPFGASLLSLIPLVAILALLYLIWREGGKNRPDYETDGESATPNRLLV